MPFFSKYWYVILWSRLIRESFIFSFCWYNIILRAYRTYIWGWLFCGWFCSVIYCQKFTAVLFWIADRWYLNCLQSLLYQHKVLNGAHMVAMTGLDGVRKLLELRSKVLAPTPQFFHTLNLKLAQLNPLGLWLLQHLTL